MPKLKNQGCALEALEDLEMPRSAAGIAEPQTLCSGAKKTTGLPGLRKQVKSVAADQ